MASKHKRTTKSGSKDSKLKYKSDLEKRLHQGALKEYNYEPFSKGYVLVKKYTPDFVHPSNDNVWFESKGRFRTYSECQKYVSIKETYPEVKLIFIFQNPLTKAYTQCKRRKDGTYMSLGEWADTNGFQYCSEKDISLFLKEQKL